MSTQVHLRLGTRGSLLAQAQSGLVARQLEALHPGLRVELITIKTTGDRITDRPLHDIGGKGLFTKELEAALLRDEIDFAVHSLKDVPVTMPLVDQSDLTMAAIPVREDPRDLLIASSAKRVQDLPPNARVGTSSLRRRCQLLAVREDLQIEMIRGNIDTRLRKLREGQHDAILLAAAGVRRAGLFDDAIMSPIPLEQMLPAAGQGALALQCRRSDTRTAQLLAAMNDPATAECVRLERQLVELLGGDCHSPIAVLAELSGQTVHVRAAVGARDGGLPVIRAEGTASLQQAGKVLEHVHAVLAEQGAANLLHGGAGGDSDV